MFCHFRPKKDLREKTCQDYSFEDTEKWSRHKRCRIDRATKLLSRIFEIFEFWPPKIKKAFFWIYSPKNPKSFLSFEKTGIYVIVPTVFYLHTKFQIDTSFFGQVIAKKLFKNDDVKFSNSIFGNSRTRRAKRRPPLDSPWRAASNRYPFYAKISTLKFDLIWPDLDLTFTKTWPRLAPKAT